MNLFEKSRNASGLSLIQIWAFWEAFRLTLPSATFYLSAGTGTKVGSPDPLHGYSDWFLKIEFGQVIHSGCYDSWILIFCPDFTAVSLDKALKDRANRALVSNTAFLLRKLRALVLLRWWWFCSQFLLSGYSYFREQHVEHQWFVWFLQANLMPFLWEEDNIVLLSKPWKVVPREGSSILIIPWENRIVEAPHILQFSMFVFCLIWPSCSAQALLAHLALPGKVFWKSEVYKISAAWQS